MVDMIASIYSDRTFQVRDGGQFSTILGQGTGIAQGCPLSPYLFIIMLSSLMAEVEEVVGPSMSRCLDITYADDTALMSEDPQAIQKVLDTLVERALRYGLTPNWSKTIHM